MIAGDVITDVRRKLRDTVKDEARWTDTVLLRYLDTAQRRVRDLRTDLFLSGASTLSVPGLVDELGDTLILDEDTKVALVNLVASEALAEDGADETNRAQSDVYLLTALRVLGVGNG